jgi:guanosine-3',5'-bis(diphosphate) 3'-pyrophosphohydrolase
VASRVDRKLVPLRTRLASGESVEIITAKSAAPKPQWLEFVVTSKARTAIRHQLKQLEHEDAVQLGHRMLDRALEELDSSLERLPQQRLDAFLSEHRYPRLEALLADVALGNWMPAQAAQALTAYAELRSGSQSRHSQEKILINGTERGVVSFANCCQPLPGDEIMGYHTAGKGIVVHRLDCPNVAEFRKSPERWIPIDWDEAVTGDYDAALLIDVENRTGVLAQVAAAVAQAKSNIDRVEYLERDINAAVLRFSIQVRDRNHLAEVMRRLRRLGVVHGVRRQ